MARADSVLGELKEMRVEATRDAGPLWAGNVGAQREPAGGDSETK